MKIKLAILDEDNNYLNRIMSVFGSKYDDKLEVYSFTDKEVALSVLESSKIDVLLSDEVFNIEVENLPKRCGFAYLVDSVEINLLRGQKAIGRYQKVDLIYKEIIDIYSEKAEGTSGLGKNNDLCTLISFCSVAGGTGCSNMAAACAMHFAKQGKRTLYLNLEKFGSSDVFFSGDGSSDMSDIIFSLKSKKSNLRLKLESCVKQDKSGVYFFSQAKIALDMLELSPEDCIYLVTALKNSCSYDYIIVDSEFSIDKEIIEFYKQMHAVVWISDGSETANMKTFRAYNALQIIENGAEVQLNNKIILAYNKFSNKTSKAIEDLSANNIGGAPRYEHATSKQVLEQLSALPLFDKILE